MAVKVFCSACDEFIKNVEGPELQKLSGKEKCTECGKKIMELYAILDKKILEFNTEIKNQLVNAQKKYATLDAAHNKYFTDAHSLYKTTKAEIDSHLHTILEGKDGQK